MEAFVARQPIFNVDEDVVAYELLFRSDYSNYCNNTNGDKATIDVLNNCFTVIGMDTLTDGKKAFINFTENLIEQDIPQLIPKELVVIEILEDVKPTEVIINACRKLKEKGYTLALDDYIYNPKFDPLIEYADIVKVDFMQNNVNDRKKIIHKYKNRNIKFLAEKVETRKEFDEAVKLGYTYFQGYFFGKPTVFSGSDIGVDRIDELKLINDFKKNSLDFDKLENIIKRDVSLSYKLLRVINSSAFGLISEITSIKQALAMLGEKNINQFIYLATLANISKDKNYELLRNDVIRAKFGELLAYKAGLGSKAGDIFLMEILSNINCFINKPLNEVLDQLPISKDVKENLLYKKGLLYDFHKLIFSYQKGEWINFEMSLCKFDIDRSIIPDLYIKALIWFRRL